MSKLQRYIKSLPPEFKPATNPIMNALLRAWAGQDDEIMTQLKNAKAQLFVKTAEGVYLDQLASSYGVSRPAELGLLDSDFRELIPNLSLKQKQVSKSFYDTMDVFWGPTFSRANILSSQSAPFNLAIGDTIVVKVDGGAEQAITIVDGDIVQPGAATSAEVVRILNKLVGVTATILVEQTTGDEQINLRTNTPGTRGSIEVVSGFGGLGFTQGVRVRITDLPQRTVLYQIDEGEILIELPAVVPTLRRTLKGSHHFHADSTIEPAVAPSNTVWQGSFLYSTNEQPYLVTQTKAILEQEILKGSVISQITVSDTTGFPATGGNLIFNWGKADEEQPVKYIAVSNNKTLLIDPGHSFSDTHAIGAEVNVLDPQQATPYAPRTNGDDFGIYLTSPANARSLVQEILESLTAAGISVRFLILLPEYKYLIDNPYTE